MPEKKMSSLRAAFLVANGGEPTRVITTWQIGKQLFCLALLAANSSPSPKGVAT